MSDNEIIKALEHCASGCSSEACRGCPFDEKGACTEKENALAIHALVLINRQKAEIERLEKYNTDVAIKHYNDGKSEAIKEFAERLKEEFHVDTQRYNKNINSFIRILTSTIDVLVKEMVGEQE